MKLRSALFTIKLAREIDAITAFAKEAGWLNDIGGAAKKTWDGVWNTGAGAAQAAGSMAMSLPNLIGSGAKGLWDGSGGGLAGGYQATHDGVAAGLNRAAGGLGGMAGGMGDGLAAHAKALGGAAGEFTAGWNGQPGAPAPAAPSPAAAPTPSPAAPPTFGGGGVMGPPAPGSMAAAPNVPGSGPMQSAVPFTPQSIAPPPVATPVPGGGGPTPQQLAQFQRGTASSFDPNSAMDKAKMQRLQAGQTKWSSWLAA